MDDRIHRALDGNLPIDQLTPDECAELHRYRAIICRALGPITHLRSIDVAAEVMGRVAPGRVRRTFDQLLAWLWSPRALSFTFRPAFAMAGTLAVAAVISLSARSSAPSGDLGPARVMVQFRLGAPAAREVALVGDFNGWRPGHRLRQVAAGVWSVDVALEPGVYKYVFVVDGKTWRLDPLAPRVADGLGSASSRVDVLPPEVRS
jgi:hypothetical protein